MTEQGSVRKFSEYNTGVLHNFEWSLRKERWATRLPFWDGVYGPAFPDYVMVEIIEDQTRQKLGLDKRFTNARGRQLHVDEKLRWGDWRDVALEFWSDVERQDPGWVCNRTLKNDHFVYAVAGLGVAYFWPRVELQAAWAINGANWRDNFKTIEGVNVRHRSQCCCVSVDVLVATVPSMRTYRFEPFDDSEYPG